MSVPADVDVAVVGVPRRDAAWFRQCVEPDQRFAIKIFWSVMPRFWLDFRGVLVEATFYGLLMHRWSAAGSVLGEDATADSIGGGVTVPGTAGPNAECMHGEVGTGSISADADGTVVAFYGGLDVPGTAVSLEGTDHWSGTGSVLISVSVAVGSIPRSMAAPLVGVRVVTTGD